MGGNLSFPTGYYECPVDLPRSQKAIAKLGQDVVLKVVRRINQIELEDRDRIHGEMLRTRFTREEVENGVADKMNKGLVVKHRLERPYGYDASEVVIDLKALADPASHGKHARYAGREGARGGGGTGAGGGGLPRGCWRTTEQNAARCRATEHRARRTCYNMCTQRSPYSWSEQLYLRHGEVGGVARPTHCRRAAPLAAP